MTTDPRWYELRNSVSCRDFSRAVDLLVANPDLFGLRNSIGETVLHFLAIENDLEGVAWLHAQGFALNTRNRFGEPMVFEVAGSGHKELVLWLTRNGADFSVVGRGNLRVLAYLRKARNEEQRLRRSEMAEFLIEHLPSLGKAVGQSLE